MTFTRVRVGHIAISDMSREPSQPALRSQIEVAIAAALRGLPGRTEAARSAALRLPRLKIVVPPGATEAEIARAVAGVLRDAVRRAR